jgi:hypothetical protein
MPPASRNAMKLEVLDAGYLMLETGYWTVVTTYIELTLRTNFNFFKFVHRLFIVYSSYTYRSHILYLKQYKNAFKI